MKNEKAIYFPGLNGLRAIAALIVVTSHIDEYSWLFHKGEVGFHAKGMAPYAVTLFFVLSGFLITYLLLLEKEKFGKIAIKKFYTRRILRIWPVYYLMVLVSFLLMIFGLLPGGGHISSLFYYLFFIPNVPFALGGTLSLLSPMWSVGVEEQFYAFWPFVVQRSKNILLMLFSVIGGYLAIKMLLLHSPFQSAYWVFSITRVDSMAIGGVGAYLLVNKHPVLKILYSRFAQILCWGIFIASLVVHAFHVFSIIDHEIYSVIYLVIILNVSTNTATLVKLENKVFNFLGKISYGMYVYHISILYLIHYLVGNAFSGLSDSAHMALIYTLTLGSTIAISAFSYKYFEKSFLSIKKRFMRVQSANTAVPAGGELVKPEPVKILNYKSELSHTT